MQLALLHSGQSFSLAPAHSNSNPRANLSSRRAQRQISCFRRPSYLYYSDATTLEVQREELKQKLPPIQRESMTPLEVEFRELLEGILYTHEEIQAVTNPRLRAIYEGIEASYYEHAVYRAFEVLYEDYLPLRVAGRMVYRKMKAQMEESKEYRLEQEREILENTNLPLSLIRSSWKPFINLGQGKEISMEEVLAHVVPEISGTLKMDATTTLSLLNPNGENEALSFAGLLIGLDKCRRFAGANLKDCEELFLLESRAQITISGIDEKRAKYNEKYDNMLEKFGEWKPYIPSGEGRRLDILKGCFEGSENPKVVEALRVVYVDFKPLRLSGDWIFRVVQTIMNAHLRRRHKAQP